MSILFPLYFKYFPLLALYEYSFQPLFIINVNIGATVGIDETFVSCLGNPATNYYKGKMCIPKQMTNFEDLTSFINWVPSFF